MNDRDVLDKLDQIARLLRELLAVVRVGLNVPAPAKSKGWDPANAEQVAREIRSLSRAANRRPARVDPDDQARPQSIPRRPGRQERDPRR